MTEPLQFRTKKRLKGLDEFETPEFVGRMARVERRRRWAVWVACSRRNDRGDDRPRHPMTHRIFTTSVASVYPHYVAKAKRKGRTKAEVDAVIRWLTGYTQEGLEAALAAGSDFERFFAEAPALNPARDQVTGSVCGVKVQEVEDPLMRLIRILDKPVDELAKGRAVERICRECSPWRAIGFHRRNISD